MRIITPSGTLAVDENTSITLTITNPMFNDRGSHSLPFSVPWCELNLALLGMPHLVSYAAQPLNDISPVTIEADGFLETGLLRIVDFNLNESINLAFLTREGLFWDWCKNTMLPDIAFPDPANHPPPNNPFPSSISCAFPVVSADEGWNYHIHSVYDSAENNIPDDTSDYEYSRFLCPYTHDFVYKGSSRRRTLKQDYTEFLYINAIIRFIFSTFGYSINLNFLSSRPEFNRLCLLNNACNAFSNNTVLYNHLVPHVSVFDFIESLENKFNCTFLINTNSRSCSIEGNDFLIRQSSFGSICGSVSRLKKEFFDISVTHDELNDDLVKELPIEIAELVNHLGFVLSVSLNGSFDPKLLNEEKDFNVSPNEDDRVIIFNGSQYVCLNRIFPDSENENPSRSHYGILSRFGSLSSHLKSESLFVKTFHSKFCLHPVFLTFVPYTIVRIGGGYRPNTYGLNTRLQIFSGAFKVPLNDASSEFNVKSSRESIRSFPLCLSIYRGKIKTIYAYRPLPDPWEIDDSLRQPFGSPFPYDYKGVLLSEADDLWQPDVYPDTLSLQTLGENGIVENFFKATRLFFQKAAVPILIENTIPLEVINLDTSKIYHCDGVNFIVDEVEMTISLNGITIDSLKGLTVKHDS